MPHSIREPAHPRIPFPVAIAGWLRDFVNEAAEWCGGRSAMARLPLLLYVVYLLVRHVLDTEYVSAIYLLNFGIHEAGHIVFRLGGEFISVAGGSFLQLAAPIASMFMFYRQRDFFAISFCFAWLGTNLYYVAWYMADAKLMIQPLAGIGDDLIHDWNYLFIHLGVLRWTNVIAWQTRQMAHLTMLISLATGAWLLWRMIQSKRNR